MVIVIIWECTWKGEFVVTLERKRLRDDLMEEFNIISDIE